jgi:hypothetical protein
MEEACCEPTNCQNETGAESLKGKGGILNQPPFLAQVLYFIAKKPFSPKNLALLLYLTICFHRNTETRRLDSKIYAYLYKKYLHEDQMKQMLYSLPDLNYQEEVQGLRDEVNNLQSKINSLETILKDQKRQASPKAAARKRKTTK